MWYARIHFAAVRARTRAVRSLGSRAVAWRAALRQARLHHAQGGRAAAVVSALRSWRGRYGRSAAECLARDPAAQPHRSEDQTSELQSLMRISYDVLCVNQK